MIFQFFKYNNSIVFFSFEFLGRSKESTNIIKMLGQSKKPTGYNLHEFKLDIKLKYDQIKSWPFYPNLL